MTRLKIKALLNMFCNFYYFPKFCDAVWKTWPQRIDKRNM